MKTRTKKKKEAFYQVLWIFFLFNHNQEYIKMVKMLIHSGKIKK